MPDKPKKTWTGPLQDNCDICGLPNIATDFVDGVLAGNGPWAIMCLKCHSESGSGLGNDRGQRYHRNADGVFEKVEG